MIILTTGGRDNYNERQAGEALAPYAEVGNVLVVGGAQGWDEAARKVWHYNFQLPYVVHPAPWDRAGKAAGPMRNIAMVRGHSIAPHGILTPDIVVAGKGGTGTRGCIKEARERGIEVVYA